MPTAESRGDGGVTERADVPDYVARNRAAWDRMADWYGTPGEQAWQDDVVRWGVFGLPESDVGMLPVVEGRDVLEVGCGTAYVSAWIARRGGRPVGLDNSPLQLATAARLQKQHDLSFPLILGVAEQLPLPDASFDVVISEYGASLWSDPRLWIPEAARVLRPGGDLVFLTNSVLTYLCVPEEDGIPVDAHLKRSLFGIQQVQWPDDDGVEFHIPHGEWIRILRSNGLDVIDLIEPQVAADAASPYDWASADWAHRWPVEEIWKARKPV